jgi:hypothetical protein
MMSNKVIESGYFRLDKDLGSDQPTVGALLDVFYLT